MPEMEYRVRAVLLAAGQATRLRPLTDDRPKCLLEVGGETILGRAVRILRERGLHHFTVVDGYRGDMIRATLTSEQDRAEFRFVRNDDFAVTNNAWSLMLADVDPAEPIMLLDADIVFAPAVIDRLLAHPAPNRLGLRTTGEIGAEDMKVRLGPDGLVVDLGKDLPMSEAAGESVGLEVFSAGFVVALFTALRRRQRQEHRTGEFYEATFVELIAAGHAVAAVDLAGLACREIDTPEDLEAARREFAES
jgi:choline kinase